MNMCQTLRYLTIRKRTAAYEALVICRKFYPWRCLPDRTQLTTTIFTRAQAVGKIG